MPGIENKGYHPDIKVLYPPKNRFYQKKLSHLNFKQLVDYCCCVCWTRHFNNDNSNQGDFIVLMYNLVMVAHHGQFHCVMAAFHKILLVSVNKYDMTYAVK